MSEEEKSFSLSELITAVSLSMGGINFVTFDPAGGSLFTSFEVNLRLSKKGYLIESDTLLQIFVRAFKFIWDLCLCPITL